MFDFVTKHKRLLQFVLALMIVPPFAFWGIQWTQRETGTGADDIANVGGLKISEQEFTEAMRQQQDRMRSLLGRNFNPALLDSPAMRAELLDGMISQRLLTQYAGRSSIVVGDTQLREMIGSIPAFQEDGKFSRAKYEALLRAEGFSPASFEASVRRDLMLQQVTGPLSDSGIASKTAARQLAQTLGQQREVAEHVIAAEPLVAQVKPSAESIRAYYEGNLAQFQVPEQVSVEYVVLDNNALLALEPVSAEDVKAYYAANAARFGEPEQRRASHILFAFKPISSDADKAKLRAKAEGVLAQLKKSPASFAEMAKKYSEDPGSAAKGGDVGYFARGVMVGAFENMTFRLKPNEMSGLVESELGYHIIKLTGIKPGKTRTLDEARPEIEKELRSQRAAKRYPEVAEAFSNLVYEQADSLKPAADKFKLTVHRADGLTRRSAPVPALNNPKVLAAIFTDDAIKNHRNTEAVEVAQNTLVAARVVEHKAPSQRPLESVQADIAKILAQREARELARSRGQQALEQLSKGDARAVTFGPAKIVSRERTQGLREEAVARVFRADASKPPVYVGVDLPNGYALYKVTRVIEVPPDEAKQRSVQTELGRSNGGEEFRSFLAGLRADTKVQINKDLLEKKTN